MTARGFIWCPHCSSPHPLGTTACPSTQKALDSAIHAKKETSHPLVGTTLSGKYRVLRLLGSGGVGEVFGAENIALRRNVAIKVLRVTSPDAVARLQREAQLLASLNHPNICGVYDVAAMPDGSPFLVLEWLVGVTLATRLKRSGPLTGEATRHVFTQILSGVGAAHAAHIVHRDMKPENVILLEAAAATDRPFVKIMDFGFAKDLSGNHGVTLTQKGHAVGTPEYMAPEQLSGGRADARTDIFAIGIMLYEALCGTHPFAASSRVEVQTNILRATAAQLRPVKGDVPPRVADVVARALEKVPERRFTTANEMQAALAQSFGAQAPR